MAGCAGSAGVGPLAQQHQLTPLMGQPFADLIPARVPAFHWQASLNQSNSRSIPSNLPLS